MAMTVDSAHWLLSDIISDLRHTEEALSIVGLCFIAKETLTILWDVALGLRAHVWSKLVKRNYVQEYGKWAVVAGATNSFGIGYARILAKNGMNIVLIALTSEVLEVMAKEIRENFRVKTEIVNADFAIGLPVYDDIEKHLKGKEIGILVNCAGMTISGTCFKNITLDDLWAQYNVSVASGLSMTKLVLPGMLARRKGAIITLRPLETFYPEPLFQVHKSTKTIAKGFSKVLDFDCQTSGITVQTVIPVNYSVNDFFSPSPSRFAAHALSTLGYTDCTTGYWIHGILMWFTDTYPSSLAMKCFMLTGLYSLRKNKISGL